MCLFVYGGNFDLVVCVCCKIDVYFIGYMFCGCGFVLVVVVVVIF
jgi:hypothetical protein